MIKQKPIYVETFIRVEQEKVWDYTQDPKKHTEWDVRFTHIDYLPRPSESVPQRFLYETNIGFGLSIKGEGESAGTLEKESGERTSSLRFSTDNPISLIKEGSGYWKYVPKDGGTRFFTQYTYKTRFGFLGAIFDAWIFRPLMGWATAWSFDSLRLWLEEGIPPRLSFRRTIMNMIVSLTLAFVWIFQGLIPKLLVKDSGELALLKSTHFVPSGYESLALTIVGIGEIVIGLLFLFYWRSKPMHFLNIFLLFLLGIGAWFSSPSVLSAPFNPVTLNLLMISLSVIALINTPDLPDARNCLRSRQGGKR